MKYKLLRFSLMSILAMFAGLWGNGAWAAEKWVKTDASELQSGDVVVIVDQTTSTAMPNDNGTGAAPAVTAVTLSSDQSELSGSVADKLQWVVTKSDAGYQFGVAGTSNYLYCTNTNNGVRVGTNENNVFKWVADADNENSTEPFLVNVATSRYIGVYNNQDWRCYTSINNNIKATVTAFYKLVNDVTDTREATTVTLGEYQTKGVVGGSMPLPSATVATATGTPLNALVTWESSDESVASITDATINFIATGTTTIKASFEGDNTYQPSHASFQLTVENSKVTVNSFRELQALCTSTTPTPATITFNGEQVVFVNGSNVFMADAQGYGALIYTGGHGLEVGQTLTGTIEASIQLYQGNAEMTSFSKEGLTIGTADVVPVEKTLGEVSKANQSTLVTLKNVTYNATSKTFFDTNNNSIAFYDKFKKEIVLEDGKNYDITGILGMYGEVLQIYPRTADDVVLLDEDNRIETYFNLAFESYEGTVGETKELGIATVYSMDDDSEVAGSDNWTVADQTIAIYNADTRSLSFLKAGTTTVTVKYDGNEEYQPCEASFALTVAEASVVEPEELTNPYAYTFEGKVFDAKSQTKTLKAAAWELNVTCEDADGYFGYDSNANTNRGQQFGSGSKPATAVTLSTADIPGNITKIVVNTSGANSVIATLGVKVGDTTFMCEEAETATLTNTATEYTFTGSASGTITLSWANESAKAIYVKSIYVEYATEEQPAGFRDIKADLTQLQALATESDVYIKVAEDGTISQADNAEEAAATLKGKWHSTNYGWSNFTASVPVEGCVKITYATHDYGNDIIVTNSEGAEVAKLNTIGAKWSSNHDNVVVAYYRTNQPTTLHFSKANYNPYFAVEAIAEEDLPAEVAVFTVTFAAGDAEEGVAPAAKEVNAGESLTMPKNYTLYKDGFTLTGWSDGTNTYAVGESVTPEADMTLTAVFSKNEPAPGDFDEEVPITFVLNGNGAQYKFEGNKGIIVTQAIMNGRSFDVKADVDATNGKFAYNGSGWHQVNSGTKVIVSSLKGAKFAVSTYNDAASVTFGGEAGVADGNTATFEATSDDETLVIEQVSNNYWNSLTIIQPAFSDEPVAEWEYRDFGIDLVSILTDKQRVEQQDVELGVVIDEDGSQTQVAYGAENANISLKGKYWNDHGWVNTEAVVKVEGPVQIDLGNCYYGNGDITVKDAAGAVVATGTMEQQHTCWGQDNSSIVSVQYKGEATTLTISYSSYLPYIGVKAITVDPDEPVNQDITGTWNFADTGIMEATNAFSGSSEAGEVEAMEKNGLMMIVEANGATFRNNGNNIQVRSGAVFKVPVRNAGDLVTVKGYPGYSHYTIGNSTVELTEENTYKAKISDAEAGYVAVTSVSDNNYYYSLSVIQYAPKEKITLDNEPATITFPFDEGTEGQKATFSNADYFLNSKVTHGSNWFIKDKNTYAGTTETRLEPIEQHNNNLTDDDAVSFLFTPKPGFTFTPTKVSFKTNRFGTDNGLIDVYWQNADGSTVELDKEVKPDRNNTEQNTFKQYDITSATPGEGTCGLKLFLYHLQATKQIGLADIVIEGILDGTEKDVPVLASFKINGNEYTVEDVFGEAFEATLELTKAERMVSANNPLTDVTATSGEVGEITYDEKDDACTVTIPMTAGDTRMDYVLNVVYKPDFTLEYIGVDGSVLATQTVEKDATIGEFAYDINEAPATKDGYKARGWFKTAVLGEKFTTADVITANTKLYAIQTEIEEASTHKKYIFDLADKFFYAEDHEAFNPAGEGFYWHDAQHGWAFKNGNTVDLLVGPKATITVTLCQYGSGTGIAVKKGEEVLETLPGIADGDGGTAVYTYEGEPGTLTLEMQCGGEMYIHGVKIVNTAEVNFESQGNWYFVKAGDAGSLIDVIEVVNGINAKSDAERSFIFLPDGTYDLDATVKTAISGHNISIIGQSMDNTVIVTTPDISVEGLGKADLFDVSGTNLYMQDLTLKNALDYYKAGSAGRAAVIQDAGNRTIAKNVRLLSYQDTYYSSNSSQQAYWETCDIHGTVDFICGGGDVRFQNTTISLEPRQTSGKGGRTITAPTTTTAFGYVFDGCKVVDLANGQGDWNFGRTWQNEPICVYLNTTLDDNAKNTLVSSRWTQKGMNNKDPKLFGEYGTMDLNGNNITPSSNKITSFGGTFETILTADQAASFAYDKMFTDWDPAQKAAQLTAPTGKYAGGAVTWTPANDGAIAYALFKNGELVGITEGSMMNVDIDATKDKLTLRAANSMGGFGPAIEVEFVSDGISEIANGEQQDGKTVYNLNGLRVDKAQRGIYIINGKKVVVK